MPQKKVLFAVIGILTLFTILRVPSLVEPHWYGDEGVYASVAQEMENGEMLYKDVWDNKPPMIYYTYMLAGNAHRLFYIRFFNLLAGMITIVGLFALTKKYFGNRLAFIATLIGVILLGTPICEGNIANAENFFLPLTVWGLYLVMIGKEKKNKLTQIIAGALFGLATFYKINAILDFVAVFTFLLITTGSKQKKLSIRALFDLYSYIVGFAFPVLAIFFLQFLQRNTGNFIDAVFFDMFSYVKYEATDTLGFLFFKQTTFSKLIVFSGAGILLFLNYRKKIINETVLFIGFIFLGEYLGTVLSTRHYVHYLLQLVPGIILILGFTGQIIANQKAFIKKINIGLVLYLSTFLVITNFIQGRAISTNFGWQYQDKEIYYKIYKYYQYFVGYKLLGTKTEDSYQNFFNFEEPVLDTLKESLNKYSNNADLSSQNIYIYTDKAWAYDYTDVRANTYFVVAYHRYLKDSGEDKIMDSLIESRPTIIAQEKNQPLFGELEQFVDNFYTRAGTDNYFIYFTIND